RLESCGDSECSRARHAGVARHLATWPCRAAPPSEDVAASPGGRMELIATIDDPAVIPDPRASRLTALKTIDGPRPPQEASSDGPWSCGGLGLADADPDERLDRASASTTEARLWPCRPQRGSADHARGEAGEDQLRLVHQDESLPRDQGGAPSELLCVGGGAS